MIAAISGCLLATSVTAADKKQITIGAGMSQDAYHQLGMTICRLVNQQTDEHGISCKIDSMGGSVNHLRSLRSGGLDLAIVQSDWQSYAYEASHLFVDAEPFKALRTLVSFHPQALTVLARAATDINGFYDLRGKRVSIGDPSSERRAIIEDIMKGYRWSSATFSSIATLSEDEQAQALCDNKLDAAVYIVHHPASSIMQATSLCELRLVRVNGNPIKRLIRTSPNYKWHTIPGGIYQGNDQAVRTFGVAVNLVASSELDADTAYLLARTILSNAKELEQFAPVPLRQYSAAMNGDTMAVPMHAGTLKYIEENKMKVN